MGWGSRIASAAAAAAWLLPPAPSAGAGGRGAVVRARLAAEPGPAISPYVFGINFAKDEHRDLARIALERWGGNRWSRFDWRTANDAAGADWFFMNGGPNVSDPRQAWYHDAIRKNRAKGIATIVTVPTIGWVAKDATSCSWPRDRFPDQEKFDPHQQRCGNGKTKDGKEIPPDPTIAGKPAPPEDIGAFVAFLKQIHGPAATEPRLHYALDNEPGLWHHTHRDVHPEKITYDEAWDRTLRYASAIKDADPSAYVWGPVEWGWLGIKYSAADNAGEGGYSAAPDSKAHGSDFFLRWYIRKLAEHKRTTGRLLVDVIDVHDYPEVYVKGLGRITTDGQDPDPGGGEEPVSWRARREAVRSWWDPAYVPGDGDQVTTWIGEPMYLLRRIQGMIREELPELKLAVTEWNFGSNDTINGVLVHALIFRALIAEGAYAATEWSPPSPDRPAFQAYRLFRNADGKGGAFAGRFVDGTCDDPLVTVFGALDEAARVLRIAVVNAHFAQPVRVAVGAGRPLPAGEAQAWTVARRLPRELAPLQARVQAGGVVRLDVPAYSVTLAAVPLAR